MKTPEATNLRVFVWPTVTLVTILTAFPLLYAFVLSLTDYDLVHQGGVSFVWLRNYTNLVSDQLFLTALKNTLKVVICATTLEVLCAFMLASILYRCTVRVRRYAQTVAILPMAMAPIAVALMWKYMFNSAYGVINYVLTVFGLDRVDWLGSSEWALLSIIIVDVWQWTPFVLLILLAGYESIETQAAEMIKVDGANGLQFLRYLVIPNLRVFLAVAILLRVIDAFKLFDIVYILTEGGPGDATETLSLYGYRLGFVYFRTGLACAESILLVIAIGIMTFFLTRIMGKVISNR